MVRKTSIEAYNAIQENGLLSKRRWEVYDVLFKHGPMTQLELASRYFPHTQARNIQPRVSELVALGVVEYIGNTVDPHTKQKAMLWDVTDALPAKREKKVRLVQVYRQALESCLHTDRTPDYEYGEPDRKGNRPGMGQRWKTPREIAKAALEAKP